MKVANQKGGPAAAMQVAFLWSKSLGADSAVKLLNKMNLLQACIDYACETYQVCFFEESWLYQSVGLLCSTSEHFHFSLITPLNCLVWD